ncbi:MAG TPA: hypothetical protein VFX23_10925 [Limnobacter sp.]|uniref:hypothetical protein n=1 Tax=Limnobacter sp. TaxID=2003368 RepID=UPI002E35C7EE|nr:hypothetical protein [Limnobacter sp.]HEX5486497.1 hypothetical protein [Limnobacter sp.]
MVFKLSLSKSYYTPVVVEIPTDGGRFDKFTFDAEFARLDRKSFNALIEEHRTGNKTDEDLISKVLVGWKGIKDDDDNDLPFSESGKEIVFNAAPQVLPALVKTFFGSLASVREKN